MIVDFKCQYCDLAGTDREEMEAHALVCLVRGQSDGQARGLLFEERMPLTASQRRYLGAGRRSWEPRTGRRR